MSCRYPRHHTSRQPSSSVPSSSQTARPAARNPSAAAADLPIVLLSSRDEKNAFERDLLLSANQKQFACYMTLHLRVFEANVPLDELRARYANVLPVDDTHTANVLTMTAAVVQNGVDRYTAHPWPIHYVAELPGAFMADTSKVHRLLRHINAAVDANGVPSITRDLVSTLRQRVEAEMAAEVASGTK